MDNRLGFVAAAVLVTVAGCSSSPVRPELFVMSSELDVAVIDPSATTSTPLREFNTGTYHSASKIAVDAVAGDVYVLTEEGGPQILVFPINATGVVAPTRMISGTHTLLSGIQRDDLAVDSHRGELYVATQAGLLVFDRQASGDSAPARVAFASAVDAVAIDEIHDEVLVATTDAETMNEVIKVFPLAAGADAPPLRQFIPSPGGRPYAVDSERDEVYFSRLTTVGPPQMLPQQVLDVYPRAATGQATPLRSFSGQYGVAIDSQRGKLYTGVYETSGIREYAVTMNAAPLRTLLPSTIPDGGLAFVVR